MSSTTSKEMAGNSQPVSEESRTSGAALPAIAEFVSPRGHKFHARPDTTDPQIFEHVVDGNEYNLPQRFEPDDIVIDIGAHIGGFSYASLERGAGKVYAYESHPQNHAIASENLARFGARASCRQRAVWRSDQPSQTLYTEDLTGHDNTGGVSLLWNTAGLAVATISLDEILAEASDEFRKPIRLLKIDCEGSEYPILFTSTQLQIVEEICGEYHEVAPERIPDRAKMAGKYEQFDRFALKEFFEDRGWTIVLEPKADLLGLFHARRDQQRSSAGEFNLDQLMSEVREAVRLREAQGATSFINASAELFKLISADGLFAEQLPESAPPAEYLTVPAEFSRLRLQPEFQPNADDHYHVNDLLKYHDREFIWNAYRGVLKREPDERGLTDFLGQLRSGSRNKIDILASLSASAEGRRANVSVEGLRVPALIRRFYRLPVVGYFAELGIALARLPALLRSQRQLENHLVAQQERLAGHIVQTNHQLLNMIDKLRGDTQRQSDSLREGSISLQQSLAKLVQQQKQIAVLQHQQVTALFREQRKSRESNQRAGEVSVGNDQPKRGIDLDDIEASLAEHLRGNPDSVKKDLKSYLTVLQQSGVTTQILDLGCGRGTWLELLKQSGFDARGVDANRRLVDMGRARGLEIVYEHVLDHLREIQENSLQAVTGFHLIEHFEFQDLLQLLMEIRRVLKPGGLIILETPNPKNLVVGACNFHADPTHHKPLFPETLQFLLDRLGFVRTRVEYLHPAEGSPFDNSEPGSQELHTWLFGPRDFAAFGWKS